MSLILRAFGAPTERIERSASAGERSASAESGPRSGPEAPVQHRGAAPPPRCSGGGRYWSHRASGLDRRSKSCLEQTVRHRADQHRVADDEHGRTYDFELLTRLDIAGYPLHRCAVSSASRESAGIRDPRVRRQGLEDPVAKGVLLLEQQPCVRLELPLIGRALRRDRARQRLVVNGKREVAVHDGDLWMPRAQRLQRAMQTSAERALKVGEFHQPDRSVGPAEHVPFGRQTMNARQYTWRERIGRRCRGPQTVTHERGGREQTRDAECGEAGVDQTGRAHDGR